MVSPTTEDGVVVCRCWGMLCHMWCLLHQSLALACLPALVFCVVQGRHGPECIRHPAAAAARGRQGAPSSSACGTSSGLGHHRACGCTVSQAQQQCVSQQPSWRPAAAERGSAKLHFRCAYVCVWHAKSCLSCHVNTNCWCYASDRACSVPGMPVAHNESLSTCQTVLVCGSHFSLPFCRHCW